jgi:uncharacterized protein (DUF1684 family)
MKRLAVLSLIFLAACAKTETPASTSSTPAPMTHEGEAMQWRRTRIERLQREDSWLTLVGLHWLSEGANTFGSDKSNALVFTPKAPPKAGTLVLANGRVTLQPAAPMTIDGKPVSAPIELKDDTDGPTFVQMGTLRWNVIKRGDKFGIRVKDSESEVRTHFRGLEYFPFSEKWRVEAKYEPYDPVKQIPITDITGMTSDQPSPGALVFTVDGQTLRLDPIDEGGDELFVIFKDETSKDATYPAGRYLYVKKPDANGRVVVDFNRAYNPPCAFTDFATCPLPPPQNRLPVRIEAGEKKYAGGHG